MKRYLIILIIITGTNLFASAPDTLWTRTYGGKSASAYFVKQTQDGGFVIVSRTDSNNIYLIRTNSSGDTLWTKTFGKISNNGGFSVQQTSDCGFIIAGNTYSGKDVCLIKTDSLGDTLWSRSYGGTDSDYGECVQQTQDGGFVIVGGTYSFGTGAPDYQNFYFIKTDSSGNTLWTKTYGGIYDDVGFSVQQTQDGGFIISGMTKAYYGPGEGDVYLIRTTSSGDVIWTKTFGVSGYDGGTSVQSVSGGMGGFIVLGYSELLGAGKGDIYFIRTNSSGNTIWTKTYGGTEYDEGWAFQQTSDSGFIISGMTTSFGAGGGDIYLIKINSSGDTLWTKTIGGTGYDAGRSIQQTSDSGFIIAGSGAGCGVYLIKLGKEVGVEEEQLPVVSGEWSVNIKTIKDKICLSVPNNYYTNTLITIYDLCGRLQSTVYNGILSKGDYTFTPKIKKNGVYFVQLKTNNFTETKKLILIK
ncbi:MAG: T9SS type A sorting domain-containing protein [bacterium]|nr:T9SS type A sorting domain-containing protein [bacterium]